MTSPDIETILFDLTCAHDPEPPSPAEVGAWCLRFPRHAKVIRAHVAAWVREELARNRVPLHYRMSATRKPTRPVNAGDAQGV